MITYLKLRWLLNISLLCCVFLFVLPPILCAEDWPQAQGSNRDNKSKETGLLDKWPEDGPTLLWTFRQSGVGYSGPAVVSDRIYIMGGRNGRTELMSIDAASGKLIWSKNNSAPFNSQVKIFKDKFFAIDFENILRCYSIKDGKELWSFKSEKSFIKSQQKLSFVISDNNLIFINTLGDLNSIDVETGNLKWQTPTQSKLQLKVKSN